MCVIENRFRVHTRYAVFRWVVAAVTAKAVTEVAAAAALVQVPGVPVDSGILTRPPAKNFPLGSVKA